MAPRLMETLRRNDDDSDGRVSAKDISAACQQVGILPGSKDYDTLMQLVRESGGVMDRADLFREIRSGARRNIRRPRSAAPPPRSLRGWETFGDVTSRNRASPAFGAAAPRFLYSGWVAVRQGRGATPAHVGPGKYGPDPQRTRYASEEQARI